MKIIKQSIGLILALLLILSLASTAFAAEGSKIEIPEFDITLEAPDNYYCVTRDTVAGNSVLTYLGVTEAELMEYLTMNEYYFAAFDQDLSAQLTVGVSPDEENSNYNSLSDSKLEAVAAIMADAMTTEGFDITQKGVYQSSYLKYMYFVGTLEDVYTELYMSSIDGNTITVCYQNYNGSDTLKNLEAKLLVDSVKVGDNSTIADTARYSPSFEYTDPTSGLSFTVPEYFEQQELAEDEMENITAKFVSTDTYGYIAFGQFNLWDKLTTVEKLGLSKSEFTVNELETEDIIGVFEELNATDVKVERIVLNGVNCAIITGVMHTELGDYTIDVKFTAHDIIKDGWMYFFVYVNESSRDFSGAYEELLNSISYPKTSLLDGLTSKADSSDKTGSNTSGSEKAATKDSSSGKADSKASASGLSGKVWIFIVAAVVLAAVIVIVLVVSGNSKNKTGRHSNVNYRSAPAHQPGSYQPAESSVRQPAQEPRQPSFCQNCGAELTTRGDFCRNCGAKVR